MCNIDRIMEMLSCHNSIEIQEKGIEFARNIKNINVFIRPLHPGCNINVWENCAKILSERTDEELKPYIEKLLEWIEDIEWDGKMIIIERLKNFSNVEWIGAFIKEHVKIANATNNYICIKRLAQLLENERLKEVLPKNIIEILNT